MSKRVSNKSSAPREGKLQGRQRVRLGWRKRQAKQLVATFKRQQWLASLTTGEAS